MKINFLLLSFAVITICGCNLKKDQSCDSISNAETLVHDGETREYIIYVPASYDGTTEMPLFFNFHGFGGNAPDFMNEADMRPLAESEGFILVYPQGACLDGFSHWNAALDTPDNKSDVDDLGFMEALLVHLSANYAIDEERVYTCGYSNGAFFSYALACYLSDNIAAIGSVSGTALDVGSTCTPSHPTAMINLHGTSDGVVPYNGGDAPGIQSVLDFWTGYNNTNTTAVITTEGNIEHQLYTDGDNGVAVSHYKINGGDHVWFDINFQGASSEELIWNFVSDYDVNGLR